MFRPVVISLKQPSSQTELTFAELAGRCLDREECEWPVLACKSVRTTLWMLGQQELTQSVHSHLLDFQDIAERLEAIFDVGRCYAGRESPDMYPLGDDISRSHACRFEGD